MLQDQTSFDLPRVGGEGHGDLTTSSSFVAPKAAHYYPEQSSNGDSQTVFASQGTHITKPHLKTSLEFTDLIDIPLLAATVGIFPYGAKHGQVKAAWEEVAKSVNEECNLPKDGPKVTERNARDRVKLLLEKWRKQEAAELRASGISPEQARKTHLLEELNSMIKELEESTSDNKAKKEREEREADFLRKEALKGLYNDSQDDDPDDTETSPAQKVGRKRRRSSRSPPNQSLEFDRYLARQSELEAEQLAFRKEELEVRKQLMQMAEKREERQAKKDEQMLELISTILKRIPK